MQTRMFLSVKYFFFFCCWMLEYTQNTDWTVFVSGHTSRMQTGMFLSVKVVVFSCVFFRMLEHAQNANWKIFVSYVFFSLVFL